MKKAVLSKEDAAFHVAPTAPVLVIYGPTGAGKTVWIESVIPLLKERGLNVATVKSCHHDLDLEPAGKDSARHLTAGAVKTLLLSPSKKAMMENRANDDLDAIRALALEPGIDLILVEGARASEFPKIALLSTQKSWNLPEPFPLIAFAGRPPLASWRMEWTEPRGAAQGIMEWLELRRNARGILGVILAGGSGKRIGGRIKARLKYQGMTLADRSAALLRCFVERVVIASPRPEECADLGFEIVADKPGIAGPLGGLVSALEKSERGILMMAVDQVGLTPPTLAEILRAGLASGSSVLADAAEIIPTVSFLARESLSDIIRRAEEGDTSLRGALEDAVTIKAGSGEEADLDTPEDLARFGIAG
ncbi:MAG: molybdopterin-guanine dinucleotide biosynthesis protein B [Candidatus Hydrogenedentota bacterium]